MGDLDANVVSCRICGAIMMRISRDICPKCHAAEEERFQKVKEYLRQHPGASAEEVARATKVPENHITYFVESGRLERAGLVVEHFCQTCNKPITAGLICSDCQRNIKEQVKQLRDETSRTPKKTEDENSTDRKSKQERDKGSHFGKFRKGS